MIPVELVGVRIEMPSNQPILLLKEISGARYLPIWVGTAEATAIAFSQQGLTAQRPLTHDLIVDLLAALKVNLRSVHLTELRDGIFYAELVLIDQSGAEVNLSCRPSDAVALSVRMDVPILARVELFDQAGISIPDQGEDEIEKFKEFLDDVSPEDFA